MRSFAATVAMTFCFCTVFAVPGHADDFAGQVKKAIDKSTLDQPGTRPFHLKAVYAPSFERDKDSHREGEVEIWWESPTRWRREVRSPNFHQIAIVDGGRQWQKNDGDYFPEWLRELAVAIVRPVPLPMDVLLQRVKTAEVRPIRLPTKVNGQIAFTEQTNINWDATGAAGDAPTNGKGYLALLNGQVFYTGGPGWSGQYHDFKDFHGRSVACTISSGYLEVTAKVSILEDLGDVPLSFFDATSAGGDAQPIDTAVLDEGELRRNLVPNGQGFNWPPIKDGPLEGVVWTEVVLDRTGKIRDMNPPIADNPGVRDAAEQGFRAMQFQPFLRNGVPVQAMGRLSESFKTVRPASEETFDSARTYFERGRKTSFLAAGATAPYMLRAEFQVGMSAGVQTGRYEDTWMSETEWKREAWVASSHFVRSQSGEQHYMLADGPDAGVLRMVMTVMEPIPAGDTMTESDWRIRRDTVGAVNAIRVFRGPEGPNGELDPAQSNGYWFDPSGQLIKSYFKGLEIRPSDTETYGGVQVARQIDLVKDGKLAMRVTVKEVVPADAAAAKTFKLKGHEWRRAFTAEVR